MDTPDRILKKLLGEVTIEDFSAREYKDKLNSFADAPFKYEGLSLQGEFSKRNGGRFCSSTPMLVTPQNLIETPRIVNMTPGICSSFAIWPRNTREANDLFEACGRATLHPQFVFLALNWSTKLGLGKGKRRSHLDAQAFFDQKPQWSNFHKSQLAKRLTKDVPRFKFCAEKSSLSKLFYNSILKGAYLTDFVKGKVDSNSSVIYKFLGRNNRQLKQKWFRIYIEVLRNELDALDKTFGLLGFPRFLILFGPTLYHQLQKLSQTIYKLPFEKLFPDRIVLYTGAFYSYRWRKQSKNLKLMRQLYYPSAAGPFHLSDFKIKTK